MKYLNNKVCYLNFNASSKLCEKQDNSYIYTNGKIVHNKHDISIRNILSDKKEATAFINDVLNLSGTKDEIFPKNIELYNNRYITSSFSDKQTDVIYKVKNKDIFYLIEHQSSVDYNMPRRIVEYKVEIIRQYIDDSKIGQKNFKTPLINAIVLYTGKSKWNVSKTIEETQVKMKEKDTESFGSYKAIDINNYSENELLNKFGALYKIILLDRSNSKEEIEKIYKKVLKSNPTGEELLKINNYANNILLNILGKEKLLEINKKYINGGVNMLAETLKRELRINKIIARKEGREIGIKQGVKQGIKQGMERGIEKGKILGKILGKEEAIISITKEMLERNINISLIKACTKLTEEEINKIKSNI